MKKVLSLHMGPTLVGVDDTHVRQAINMTTRQRKAVLYTADANASGKPMSFSLERQPSLQISRIASAIHTLGEAVVVVDYFHNVSLKCAKSVVEAFYRKPGVSFILRGLNVDAWGKAYPSMLEVAAHATETVRLRARCEVCKALATIPFDKRGDTQDEDQLKPRCWEHWREGMLSLGRLPS